MIVVYVKHYINENGMKYFDTQWLPYVDQLIRKQDGFLDITTSQEKDDPTCINIMVKFTDEEKLTAWANNPDHAKVINDLDIYRVSNQRWFVTADDNAPAPLEKWEIAPLPNCSPGAKAKVLQST